MAKDTKATAKAITLADVNRSALSRDTGVDIAHISRIFNPKHPDAKPSLDLAIKLSKALNISVEDLCALIGKNIGGPNEK